MASELLTIERQHHAGSFSAIRQPVLSIEPGTGTRIAFETNDASFQQMDEFRDIKKVTATRNAVTGPVYVEGAEPGDVLAVTVHHIQTAEQGWSVYIPGAGALAKPMGDELWVRRVPLRDGYAYLTDQVRLPIQTMIGCIGVAPAEGEANTIIPCFRTGGNFDVPDIKPGATLYLPVEVEGALLSLGDLHAAMARGESSFIGIETAGVATVSIDLIKSFELGAPRIDTGDEIICIGLGDPLRESIRAAYESLFDYLVVERGWDRHDAYIVMSAAAHTELGGPVGSEQPDPLHPLRAVGAITVARLDKALADVHATRAPWGRARV
ncbi:acetamidase/formamidase family protein [Micromonospora sp. NBC_01655]|uniref:acetamidase/formamidase family protein n=1 Tax=unclassified Micromonospora TaxID=2617518 RepID=UPI000E449847|nr:MULTISPECIES: acetamidase/formamidase family protein [unclassified Micromonospora]MCX4471908.1 acetamidase/formamidase family protein [Micromonospora sp. NBC_01655]